MDIYPFFLSTLIAALHMPFADPRQAPGDLDPKAWNVLRIGAKAWWGAGYDGSGVIIGIIDIGFKGKLPPIMDSWVGKEGGWKDPSNPSSVLPEDFPYGIKNMTEDVTNDTFLDWTRGTVNLGIMVGKKIGIAPGARWIGCALDPTSETTMRSTFEKCADFMLCPNPDESCSYRPNVVVSIIGVKATTNPALDKQFDAVLQKWQDEKIIPVFSAQQESLLKCGGISYPGNHEDVLAIGVVDDEDDLSVYSPFGPPTHRYSLPDITSKGIYKPDFVAPGQEVYSLLRTGNLTFVTTPYYGAAHAAGAIALLLSRNQEFTLKDVKVHLKASAVADDIVSPFHLKECGKIPDETSPNFKFGWGRLQLPSPTASSLPVPNKPTRPIPPPPDLSTGNNPKWSVLLLFVGVLCGIERRMIMTCLFGCVCVCLLVFVSVCLSVCVCL